MFKKCTAPAIAIVVGVTAGCGGGGAGIRPDMPTVQLVEPHAGINAANPSAIDVGDHWKSPDNIVSALDATPTGGGTSGLTTAQGAIEAPSSRASSMQPVNPSRMSIIGSQDDITVGRWTSGPADTLDIEFYYEPGTGLSNEDKARIRRAGKAWSRYIRTEFVDRTIEAGTVVEKSLSLPSTTIDTSVEVDDMLIVVSTRTNGTFSHGGASGATLSNGEFTPAIGYIHLNTSQNHHQRGGTIVHEIGHAIIYTTPNVEGFGTPLRERHLNEEGTHFTGPAAMRENNGQPVPFQWVDANNQVVEPGTAGAVVDLGHPAVCSSVMSYCRDRSEVQTPSALDIAWLDDLGYEVDNAATALQAEVYGYGAWATYSAWGTGVARDLNGFEAADDRLEVTADAFGVLPAVNLADAPMAQVVGGSAIWRGILIGVDTGATFAPVTGDAALNISFDTMNGTAAFDNLTAHADGSTQAFRTQSLRYAVSVDGNGFSDIAERIEGNFYGPAHQEMAGVVEDDRPSVGLTAAFGGTSEASQ